MNIITMLPWCPLLLEVFGVMTSRRYFTLLHTSKRVMYFDGEDAGCLSYPAALIEFQTNERNRAILKAFDWKGGNIKKIPHIVIFDQLLERIVVVNYKRAVQLLTFENKDNSINTSHHDIVKNEAQAVEILNNWLLNSYELTYCTRVT